MSDTTTVEPKGVPLHLLWDNGFSNCRDVGLQMFILNKVKTCRPLA